MVVVNHFEGLHANMPKSAPLVVSEYAPVGKGLHLMRQFSARGGPGGKAVTTFYHYDEGSKHLPAAAFVYYGNIKAVKDAPESSRCMTLAYDPKSGNVAAVCGFDLQFCCFPASVRGEEERGEGDRHILPGFSFRFCFCSFYSFFFGLFFLRVSFSCSKADLFIYLRTYVCVQKRCIVELHSIGVFSANLFNWFNCILSWTYAREIHTHLFLTPHAGDALLPQLARAQRTCSGGRGRVRIRGPRCGGPHDPRRVL